MRVRNRRWRRLRLAALVAAPLAAMAGCAQDPAAPSFAASARDAYVGGWIVDPDAPATLPLGLTIAALGTADSATARVTYSGFAHDARGRIEPGRLVLVDPATGGAYVRLIVAVLRRDGRLAVRLDAVGPGVNSVPVDVVLVRRED